MSTLVIVESPAEARKIAGLLGAGFTVRATLARTQTAERPPGHPT